MAKTVKHQHRKAEKDSTINWFFMAALDSARWRKLALKNGTPK